MNMKGFYRSLDTLIARGDVIAYLGSDCHVRLACTKQAKQLQLSNLLTLRQVRLLRLFNRDKPEYRL